MSAEQYNDFDLVERKETFRTNGIDLRPGMEAVVPLECEHGIVELYLHNVQHDPSDPEHFNARGKAEIPPGSRRFIVDKNVSIARDENTVKVGEELVLDPDAKHKGIKSKKLWAAIGGVATVAITGIVVTRKVIRARKR